MFVPYAPLSNRRTKLKPGELHSALAILLMAGLIACLVVADPHRSHAAAVISAAAQWLHAAFPQLIK